MALIVGASLVEDAAASIAGLVLVGAGLGLGAVVRSPATSRRRAPVPEAAFASANLRTGTAISFVNTATTSSTGVLATLLLQRELGVSPVLAGTALVPFSLGVIGGSGLSRPLGQRLRVRWLAAVGLGGIAAGNLLLVLTTGSLTTGSIPGIVAGVLLAGIGLGIASVAGTALGTDVADALSGTASGVLNTGAQLGTALGVAALLLLAAGIDGATTGTAVAWAVAALLAGLTAGALVVTSSGRDLSPEAAIDTVGPRDSSRETAGTRSGDRVPESGR